MFNAADLERLITPLYHADTAQIHAWIETHITDTRSMAILLTAIPRIIADIWPRTHPAQEGEFWAFQARPDTDPATIRASQLITAALNHDDPAIAGLVDGTLEHPDLAWQVGGELLAALHRALHGLTRATNTTTSHRARGGQTEHS